MRISRLVVAVALLVAPAAARAGEPSKLFFIPAASGYGISECFSPGANCGKVVADAYCESKGYGVALAYGRAEDITATVASTGSSAKPIETGSLVVKCGD